MIRGRESHHYSSKMISALLSSQDKHFTTSQYDAKNFMKTATSELKLFIPWELNIQMNCGGALLQSSVGKEFPVSQTMRKLLIKSSYKLFLIRIW